MPFARYQWPVNSRGLSSVRTSRWTEPASAHERSLLVGGKEVEGPPDCRPSEARDCWSLQEPRRDRRRPCAPRYSGASANMPADLLVPTATGRAWDDRLASHQLQGHGDTQELVPLQRNLLLRPSCAVGDLPGVRKWPCCLGWSLGAQDETLSGTEVSAVEHSGAWHAG